MVKKIVKINNERDIVVEKYVYTDNELKLIKKKECREKIESKYKEHDQINVLMSWTTTEKTKMKTYIEACLDEYRTKWKDADYKNIK